MFEYVGESRNERWAESYGSRKLLGLEGVRYQLPNAFEKCREDENCKKARYQGAGVGIYVGCCCTERELTRTACYKNAGTKMH